MPNEREFEELLVAGFVRNRVPFIADGPFVTSFMVQLEVFHEDEWKAVRRYDDSHGQAHVDLLDKRGREYGKEWLDMDRNSALTMALQGFKINGRRYVAEFLER